MLDLPSELWLIVVDHVNAEDLPQLRLTSRTLSTLSTERFGTELLSNRRFIFTKHSLQGLVDLSAHPVLSTYVQCITFGVQRLRSSSLDCDQSYKQSSIDSFIDCRDQQSGMLESELHIELLAKALENLNIRDQRVTLGTFYDYAIGSTDKCPDTPKAFGYDKFFGRLQGLTFADCGLDDPAHTLKSVIFAAMRSGFPVHRLELQLLDGENIDLDNDDESRQALKSLFWPKPGTLNPDFELVLRNTGYHDLFVNTSRRRMEWHGREDAPPNPDCPCRLMNEECGGLKSSLGTNTFRELRLESVCITTEDLFDTLRPHARSMKCIELRNVMMETSFHSEPLDLLERMRDELPGLEKLVIQHMHGLEPAGTWSQDVDVEGGESVHKELVRLVQHWESLDAN